MPHKRSSGAIAPFYILSLGLYLLFFISNASAGTRFVLHNSKGSLVNARIDPIISPGGISQHVHHVVGGSNFNTVYDPVKLRQSKCSNLGVGADMSNYWAPALYQLLANGSVIAMSTNTRIYYEQPKTAAGVSIEAFPYDFRMIAGDAKRKTFNPLNQGHILQVYYCEIWNKDGSKSGSESYTLPKKPCDIITTKTWFPTCWNGKNYDPASPTAHMRYPVFGGGFLGPQCPTEGTGANKKTWPRRFVSIHMETFYWRRKEFAAPAVGQQQFILANGDTTGYGLHADFANGWDTNVLNNVIKTCKTTPVEEPPEQACAALRPSSNRAVGDSCMYQNKIPDEDVGYKKALRWLPGCNLPWASGAKPGCNAKIYPNGDPKWIQPAAGTKWP